MTDTGKTVSVEDIFICQQCGYCCQGETTVSLDPADVERMLAHLGLPEEEVRKRFWRVTGNVIQMRTVDSHCIFYADGCTIHPGKPWRCTQWPLHPSMLIDRGNYQTIRNSCPGINRELGYEEFREILAALLYRSGPENSDEI